MAGRKPLRGPIESQFERSRLVLAEQLVPPAVWLASDDSHIVTGRCFFAASWDGSLPGEVAAAGAGAPIARLGRTGHVVFPEGHIPSK
jgi:hypothetical protein